MLLGRKAFAPSIPTLAIQHSQKEIDRGAGCAEEGTQTVGASNLGGREGKRGLLDPRVSDQSNSLARVPWARLVTSTTAAPTFLPQTLLSKTL